MISKKHFTKSMATILSTLTFLTAVSPCTFAEKNFNRNTTRSMSTAKKFLLVTAIDISFAAIILGYMYFLNQNTTTEPEKTKNKRPYTHYNENDCTQGKGNPILPNFYKL